MKRSLLFSVCVTFVLTVQAQLPKVTLKDIHGKEVSTDTLSNQGRPFIIDFFATWCKPCNRELDAISEVYEDWQQETGVKIIAVSLDQAHNINKVKPLVDNHGWDYEVLLDPNGELKHAFGIQMIPYVLIVDGQGNIVYKHQGYTDGAEEELIDKVREKFDTNGILIINKSIGSMVIVFSIIILIGTVFNLYTFISYSIFLDSTK